MKGYFKLYLKIIKMSFANFLVFRADALINIVFSAGIWTTFNVASMYLVMSKAKTAFGWSLGELLLISCIYNIFIGIWGFFFARGFSMFSEITDTGRLDLFLLKPIDSQFYLSLHTAGVGYLVRTILGTALGAWIIHTFQLPVSFVGVLLFITASLIGMLLLYSLLFFLNIFVIWAPKLDNINELFYSLRSLGRYPRETFRQLGELGFVLLSPFVMILSTPTRFLLGKGMVYDFVELAAASFGVFVLVRLFWIYALRHYTSASS